MRDFLIVAVARIGFFRNAWAYAKLNSCQLRDGIAIAREPT